MISTWIEFLGSFDNQTRSNIVSWLKSSGIYARDMSGADEAESGIVVFQTIDDDLLSTLRHKSRTTAVIALKIGQGALPHGKLWSMIHAGAFDVLQWPSLPERADAVACRLQRRAEVDKLVASELVTTTLVGTNPAWRSLVRSVVEAAAFTNSSVLITGESGTGKEHVARLIHDLDPRRDKGDFVIVDCTTISSELSGSELFGHERGSFTGAMAARDGAFALAHRGTLFLDEVGELRPELQAQLLRAVQERRYKRVGSNMWQATDLRIVAATNRDLQRGLTDGSFRADLYFRIAGWECRTPPLRERKDDILILAKHFIAQLLPDHGEVVIDSAVEEFLVARDYPGNVRELRQLMTRICHRHAGSGAITIGDIPTEDRVSLDPEQPSAWPESSFRAAIRAAVELGICMKDITRAASEVAVETALEREGRNLQRAAIRLGVTDRTLQVRRSAGVIGTTHRKGVSGNRRIPAMVGGLPLLNDCLLMLVEGFGLS